MLLVFLSETFLFILVFLGFNKEQRQYGLQNRMISYISPYSVAVELLEDILFYLDSFLFLPTILLLEYICCYYRRCEIYAEDLSNQEIENKLTEHQKPPLL